MSANNRNCVVKVLLNKKELVEIDKRRQFSSLSRSGFLRWMGLVADLPYVTRVSVPPEQLAAMAEMARRRSLHRHRF